jgi:hypothetical protein
MTAPQQEIGAPTADEATPPVWFLGAVVCTLASVEEGDDATALALLELPAGHVGVARDVPSAIEDLALRAWPDAPGASAVVWAALVHPLAHVLPRETNTAFAIRVARMALGAGTTMDHLTVVVMLWWLGLKKGMTGARQVQWMVRPASVLRQWGTVAGSAGAVLEWMILLPGRSVQLTVTHLLLRLAGSRPVLGRPAFSQPLRWSPLPAATRAVMVTSAAMLVLWLAGVAALVAYQAPGSWLALVPALPAGAVQDEATLVIASSVVQNYGPLGLGLWIPLSLLAVSVPAYSELLALREACRGGTWNVRAVRVILAPAQWVSFLVWPLARLFSFVGLGTIFGSGLVGVASGSAAAHVLIRVLA